MTCIRKQIEPFNEEGEPKTKWVLAVVVVLLILAMFGFLVTIGQDINSPF